MQIFLIRGGEIFPEVAERSKSRESTSQVWMNLKHKI